MQIAKEKAEIAAKLKMKEKYNNVKLEATVANLSAKPFICCSQVLACV
jgi:hypothetical protein